MSLVVALKYSDGTVLAGDTREMIGEDLKRDRAIKLEPLTDDIAIAATGLSGAADDILRPVKAFCSSSAPVSFDTVVSRLSDSALDWHKKNFDKLAEEDKEASYVSFIAVSPERIRKVLARGYAEESHNYETDGTGQPYAEYIVGKSYRTNMSEGEAKELAVYAILETSKVDPSVGNDIELIVFPRGGLCKTISKEETEDMKLRSAPLSRDAEKELLRTVQEIVSIRDQINDLCQAKFGFRLLHPSERAVFQIMKPCRTEEEFTSNIAAMALLVEQLNVQEMKKVVTEEEGSINILEEFARQRIKDFPSEIIQAFRDIMTMRSKKFPIHVTDPKFIEVVHKLTKTYPPNWADLYIRTLNSYEESLNKLRECLAKTE